MKSTNGSDRTQILRFLRRVDRRLRFNDFLESLAHGLWGLLALLLVLKLAGFWEINVARNAVLLSYGVGLFGFLLWRYVRGRGLFHSAAVGDTRANLKDALKSALAFLGLPERTPWMEFQIRRTAETAERLEPAETAPTVLPRPLLYASGLNILLAGLLVSDPVWLRELERPDFFARSERSEAESMEEILDPVEAPAPEELQELEELDQAIERLRRQDLELSESLRDLGEAKEALAASRSEMERLEMDLEQVGERLESTAALAELAEALKAHDAEKAAELLRELAERLADAQTSEALQALLESLQDADVQHANLSELMESLQNAGDLSEQSLAEMAQALEQAASQLEQMSQGMAMQQPPDAAGEQMQSLQAAAGGQQEQAQGQQQQPGGQAMQSAQGMTSNQVQMAEMQGDPSSAVPVDAGPAGDTTGPGGGEQPVLGEPTSLEVQLEMEVLKTEERDEPIPEEIFERLSREEKSSLNYEAVRQRGSYAEESALGGEHVPWQYRALVKRYFLTILSNSNSNAQSEPSREK